MRLPFQIQASAKQSRARAGTLTALHGQVLTPTFMPVGTQATVKNQRRQLLEQIGAQVLLANTYHLLQRPGLEVFKRFGGIHRFMGWDRNVLTDSGGYQIFSLPGSCTVDDRGAVFVSHLDQRKITLTPELSIEAQRTIHSDIMMVLDQCVPSTCQFDLAFEAMKRTHEWAVRSLNARGESRQALFGIVQGACFEDLRRQSAEFLTSLSFDGFAIGGLAVGESKTQREDFTELTTQFLPLDRPRYLMGVGTPIDLLEAVHRGVDLFDCILPTSLAQRGVVFTSLGRLELRRGVYKLSDESLDSQCDCTACVHYSRAYLHHLVKTQEPLGWSLLGEHNLKFYLSLMHEIREQILAGSFDKYYQSKRQDLVKRDEHNPVIGPRVRSKKTKSKQLGFYEVVVSPAGYGSIKHRDLGETMHSVSEPIKEAQSLYIEGSGFRFKIKESPVAKEKLKPLVVWDVGLGAATNAMAAILEYQELQKESLNPKELRPLKLVSFENDLDSLKLALQNKELFKYLRHPAPHQLLEEGHWQSKDQQIEWKLVNKDFLGHLSSGQVDRSEIPDLIFYDPFSYKSNPDFWTLDTFSKLFEFCQRHSSRLFTYSASTRVRAALLSAGWWVAKGKGTGPKAETTIALTPLAAKVNQGYEWLGQEWINRWKRSRVRTDQLHLEERLLSHSQWGYVSPS